MKFLHIADLHIGKCVNGFPLLGEQIHAFEQILSFVKNEKPQAVVIAGDVYDRAVPAVEAVNALDNFLTALAGEGAPVLVIPGNHDSPERLGYGSRLLRDRGLYLCRPFDGALKKVTLTDEHGEVHFWLLPFIKPSTVESFFREKEKKIEAYDDALSAVLESAGVDYGERNVLVSHQLYTRAGVTPVRSESELNPVGGLDGMNAALIEKFDYAALGHLHGAQEAGAPHLCYAGSPVKYSFSEWRQQKSAALVELEEKGRLTVKRLPLTPLRDMRELRGRLDDLVSDGIFADNEKNEKEDYLRVILTDEDEIVDPMGKLRSVYPNIMSLEFANTRTGVDLGALTAEGAKQNIETLSPYDLFREFFLDTQGAAMSEAQEKIARNLFEEEEEQP